VTGQNNLKKIKRREEEKEKIQEEINYFWEKLKTLKKLEIDYSPIIRIINILKNSARLEIVE
jgi:coenzyme F420-reducing hydrogenase delta subunit